MNSLFRFVFSTMIVVIGAYLVKEPRVFWVMIPVIGFCTLLGLVEYEANQYKQSKITSE
ncbi:hypothetical protein [Alteromonas macleodii]|uniref:hypothetical protein n=1 Tax=Alteromonas macleodii TaxID=28108 RepID=UPI0031403E7A